MGKLGRDHMRRKLERHLACSDDEAMINVITGTVVAIGGNATPIGHIPDLPPEAVGATLGSEHYIPPWVIETLVNELLALPKAVNRRGSRVRHLRPSYTILRMLAGIIRRIENAEDGIYLETHDVMDEMGRLVQRQFPWQRGQVNAANLYRSVYLYGSGSAGAYFEASTGIAVADFIKMGVYLLSRLGAADQVDRRRDLSEIKITPEVREAALAKLVLPIGEARWRASLLRGVKRQTAYKPSILREFPILAFGFAQERLRAPLPELIMYRVTKGLYRDVVKADGTVRGEIGRRFEQYCLDFLDAMMTPYTVRGEATYGTKKAGKRTPDVLVRDAAGVIAAVECKSAWMSLDARFGDDPVVMAKDGFAEITKAIFQLWRFFAHARLGLVGEMSVASDCLGIVITADYWLTMASTQRARVYQAAHDLADKEGGILPEDRREIAICPIDDVEYALMAGTADTFLATCREISSGAKNGWMLSVAHDTPEGLPRRDYPFIARITDLLPWFTSRGFEP